MIKKPKSPGNISHVGIIMDGNGRWAKDRGHPRAHGHLEGAKVVKKIIQGASDLGIKILTIYAFSTENWKRPKYEINVLMSLFNNEIMNQYEELVEQNVHVRFIGSIIDLPLKLQKSIKQLEEKTKNNDGLVLQVALNYGGRRDITEAVKKICHSVQSGLTELKNLTEDDISKELSTYGYPDPDLVIRTSGELRISNFLLWQVAYSELAFTEKHWPDFTVSDLKRIIEEVSRRNRRFGAAK